MPEHATALALPDVGHLETFEPLKLAIAGFLARYRGSTFTDYRTDLNHFLSWCDQHGLPPLQATRPHLELYVRWLEDKKWASSTVARRFGTVSLFFRYATLDELIGKDPAISVTKPQVRRDEQRRTFLTPLEFAGFLAAAREMGPQEHALTALLGLSGLRIGEACGLDVASLTVESGYDTLRFIGKGHKPAVVPLPVPVMRAVREAIKGRDVGPILLNSRGRRLSGVPLRDMQVAMRHSDPATTTLYDMATGSPDRLASHRVASYLAGMTG